MAERAVEHATTAIPPTPHHRQVATLLSLDAVGVHAAPARPRADAAGCGTRRSRRARETCAADLASPDGGGSPRRSARPAPADGGRSAHPASAGTAASRRTCWWPNACPRTRHRGGRSSAARPSMSRLSGRSPGRAREHHGACLGEARRRELARSSQSDHVEAPVALPEPPEESHGLAGSSRARSRAPRSPPARCAAWPARRPTLRISAAEAAAAVSTAAAVSSRTRTGPG